MWLTRGCTVPAAGAPPTGPSWSAPRAAGASPPPGPASGAGSAAASSAEYITIRTTGYDGTDVQMTDWDQ